MSSPSNSKPEETAIEFCVREYPEMMVLFKEIQAEDYAIFASKQKDYGPGNIALGTTLSTEADRRMSLTGLIIRMNDKIQRLLNLVVKTNRAPENESIADAFMDLSVYGIIARIVKEGKWAK
jgi:hypothetical protein